MFWQNGCSAKSRRTIRWPSSKKVRKVFFSEEKKQKTFIPGARGKIQHCLDRGSSGDIKVSWFFSSEKNFFLNLPSKTP
jgi:hypothetical protein